MARSLLACAATAALLMPGALGFAPRMQPLPRVSTAVRMSVVGGEQQPPQQLGGGQPSLWRRVRAKWSEGKEGMGKLLLGVGTGALAGFGAPRTASVLQGKWEEGPTQVVHGRILWVLWADRRRTNSPRVVVFISHRSARGEAGPAGGGARPDPARLGRGVQPQALLTAHAQGPPFRVVMSAQPGIDPTV